MLWSLLAKAPEPMQKTCMANFIFGYGSLVNRGTHGYGDAAPATLNGWRRRWCSTPARDVAYLSVWRLPGAQIDGLVARVGPQEWAALDSREEAYERQNVLPEVEPAPGHAKSLIAFSVPESNVLRAVDHPIYLSYVDVVVQGYLDVFGQRGAAAFFDTTDGWDRPILDDRAAPMYPRHQKLEPEEKRFVDNHLARLSGH